GHYGFNNFDGLALGTFQINVIPLDDWTATNETTRQFTFTRGNIDVDGVNFGFVQTAGPGKGVGSLITGVPAAPAGDGSTPAPVGQGTAGVASGTQPAAETAGTADTPPAGVITTDQGIVIRAATSNEIADILGQETADAQALASLMDLDYYFVHVL